MIAAIEPFTLIINQDKADAHLLKKNAVQTVCGCDVQPGFKILPQIDQDDLCNTCQLHGAKYRQLLLPGSTADIPPEDGPTSTTRQDKVIIPDWAVPGWSDECGNVKCIKCGETNSSENIACWFCCTHSLLRMEAGQDMLTFTCQCCGRDDWKPDGLEQNYQLIHRAQTGVLALFDMSLSEMEAVIESAPPGDPTGTYTWLWGHVCMGDEFWDSAGRAWIVSEVRGPSTGYHIIRTVVNEQLTGDQITDAIVRQHGRIPCQFFSPEQQEWLHGILIYVGDQQHNDFPFLVEYDSGSELMARYYRRCRIDARYARDPA